MKMTIILEFYFEINQHDQVQTKLVKSRKAPIMTTLQQTFMRSLIRESISVLISFMGEWENFTLLYSKMPKVGKSGPS